MGGEGSWREDWAGGDGGYQLIDSIIQFYRVMELWSGEKGNRYMCVFIFLFVKMMLQS